MVYNLKEPEDWYIIKAKLRLRCFEFPQFLHDFDRMCRNIENKVRELGELNIQVKRNNTIWHRQLRDNKIAEINDTIKTFSKILLVATLSKR